MERWWLRRSKWPRLVMVGLVAAGLLGGGAIFAKLGGVSTLSSSSDISLQKGLVGEWKLDGNTNDATPYANNAAIHGGVVPAADRRSKANSAYILDGSTGYLSTTNSFNNPQVFSASVWFNTTSASGGGLIGFDDTKAGTPSNWDRTLLIDTSGKIQICTNYENSCIISANSYNDGKWHLAVATVSADAGMVLYIDGGQVGANSNTVSQAFTGWWRLGRERLVGFNPAVNSDYFDGTLDEARIYNRALNVAEVTALYSQYDSNVKTDSGENGLVGWWPMQGNANDATPYGDNGVVFNATLTNDRKGKANSAYSFDGSSSYIDTGAAAVLTPASTITVSAWVNGSTITDTGNNATGIVCKDISGSITNPPYCLFAIGTGANDGKLCWTITNSSNTNTLICTTTFGPLSNNTWYHVVGTYDGNLMQIFLNGNRIQTSTGGVTGAIGNTTGTLKIGRQKAGYANRFFTGTIDDVRIYNRVLSAGEISNLYNSYNPRISLGGSGQADSVSLGKGLVGDWPLNGNANDATPYSGNGTITNATLTTDRKNKANAAYSFNGSSSQISIPNSTSLSPTGAMSVSVWFRGIVQDTSYATDGGFVGIVSKDVSSGISNPPYSIQVSNGTVTFNTDNASNAFVSTGASGLLDNTWYHVVGTFDGTTMKVYLNGAFKGSAAQAMLGSTTGVLRIGTQKNGFVRYFNGTIDDVRIWNRALSASEVSQLYGEYR